MPNSNFIRWQARKALEAYQGSGYWRNRETWLGLWITLMAGTLRSDWIAGRIA